jgi:hypothetical protein
MKALAIQKCEIVVPISSQLPESRTRKKKLRVITSVVERTSKNRENGGSSKHRDRRDRAEESKKNGIKILKRRREPIKNGSNTVVNRYTDSIEKDDIDAKFPVPKKAILTKNKKKLATRISVEVNIL